MKTTELRQQGVPELKQRLVDLLKEQFKLKMSQGSAQLTKTHLLGKVRKHIARVLTVLRQKQESSL